MEHKGKNIKSMMAEWESVPEEEWVQNMAEIFQIVEKTFPV